MMDKENSRQSWKTDLKPPLRRRDWLPHFMAGAAVTQAGQASNLSEMVTQFIDPSSEDGHTAWVLVGGITAIVCLIIGYKISEWAYDYMEKSPLGAGLKRTARVGFSIAFIFGMICLGAYIQTQTAIKLEKPKTDIAVTFSSQSAEGFDVKDLLDPVSQENIKNYATDRIKELVRKNNPASPDIERYLSSLKTVSSTIETENTSLVVIRIESDTYKFNGVIVHGISNGMLNRVGCLSENTHVVITTGRCAQKMKEVFGTEF